ncbi:unnamed protein product [Pylaiella littoralis]
MIQVTGRRAEKAVLILLCLGGKRSSTAFRARPALHQRRHVSRAVNSLSSTAVDVAAEPARDHRTASSEKVASLRQLSKAVVVARGKARLFWEGNPLVYGGAVSRVEGGPVAGDVVDVIDSSGQFIAWGVYNPDSMYRVRVLAKEGEAAAEARDVRAVVKERLVTARDARRAIGIPNANTDTYRLVNGEGDRLSGLVVDVFAGVVGVSSSAVWVETFRADIEGALEQVLGADATEIIWRRSDGRLQQDGWKGNGSGDEDSAAAAAAAGAEATAAGAGGDGKVAEAAAAAANSAGESPEGAGSEEEGRKVEERRLRSDAPTTVVRELGLEYLVRPQFGQKTGFYCDQRESRAAVRELSAGKNVLDMFCYSGGFSLNAAAGGALRVTAVDSSQPALEEAEINAARNNLVGLTEFIKDDALKFMKQAKSNGDKYDMVVLDPPKFAPNKKSLPRATSRYKRLNAAALELIAPGGILVTFTCSAAMTQGGGFVGVVQSAAAAARRTITLLKTVGPAADHVTNPCYPEGAYLTGAFFYVV